MKDNTFFSKSNSHKNTFFNTVTEPFALSGDQAPASLSDLQANFTDALENFIS